MRNILVVHGPNLNLLGERDPAIYGSFTLSGINARIRKFAKECGVTVRIFQSNHEGALIDFIHRNRNWADGMVFNPGALSHYSYALRDAVSAMKFPTVEVHLSDIGKREKFRKVSVIAPVCVRQISGLGYRSYIEGVKAAISCSRR